MALIQTVAGAYVGTYTPSPYYSGVTQPASGQNQGAGGLGIMMDNGYEIVATTHAQLIDRTDQYAQTLLDFLYQGSDWRINFMGREYSQNLTNAAYPWGNLSQTAQGQSNLQPLAPMLGTIGQRASRYAGALVLNSTLGTPAYGNPLSLTALQAVAAPNSNFSMLFTSRNRDVAVQMVLLPYAASIGLVPLSAIAPVIWFTCA